MIRHCERSSYRDRVLEVLDSSLFPLTGYEVARLAGLNYKQAIDALDALYNMNKVTRLGKKESARWTRLERVVPSSDPLNDLILSLMSGSC